MTALTGKASMPLSRQPEESGAAPAPARAGEAVCFPLDPLPQHLKPRYRRLALVTCAEHVAALDPDDSDTLIVSSDWLLWQRAAAERRHALYYERGILEWTDPDSMDTDIYLRANDWNYADGRDLTLFRGVSLGKMFCGEVAMCVINCLRLERALAKLIDRFQPEDVLFFDFINEFNVLDRELRVRTLQRVAATRGARLIDRPEGAVAPDRHISEHPTVQADSHRLMVSAALYLYANVMALATRLRCLARDPKRRVLALVITNLAEPLARNYSAGAITPIIFARTLPKKFGLLWHCLRQGILLPAPAKGALTAEDRRHLNDIIGGVKAAFAAGRVDVGDIVARYVTRQILDTGRLAGIAEGVRAAERFLADYRPARLVIDGERNAPQRIYAELCRSQGIPVDCTWHSPLTPLNNKLDGLGSDSRTKPVVSRSLTWGRTHERWLDAIGAKQSKIRIGSPVGDRYRRIGAQERPRKENALILQYTPQVQDLRGLNANMFGHFVDTVRLLRDRGYRNIRYKLHPGPGRLRPAYFESIADFFGLGCPILKREPFGECVAWADIVIGPASTGAMFETLAAGKPYYAMLMPPHSMDPSYFGDYPIYASVAELADALGRPIPAAAGRKLLDALYSLDEYPSGSRRFWEVMESDVRRRDGRDSPVPPRA